VNRTEQDVQFLPWRRAQAIDKYGYFVARLIREIIQQVAHELDGDFCSRFESTATHAGLSVDTHSDLHLPRRKLEGRPSGCWNHARRKGYAHGPKPDGVAVGDVFASPSSEQILEATRAVDGGAGVLYLYGNYSGDVMNFDLAGELALTEGQGRSPRTP
jgi:hypothetical protein